MTSRVTLGPKQESRFSCNQQNTFHSDETTPEMLSWKYDRDMDMIESFGKIDYFLIFISAPEIVDLPNGHPQAFHSDGTIFQLFFPITLKSKHTSH